MKSLSQLTICCALLLPIQVWGAVIISEIAWMGDSDSANHEWIELHNTGGSTVDLTGWQLRDANTLSIDMTGTIAAGTYVVLERNRASEQYLFSQPFLVYTGALVNSGTTLTLYQASGAIADQVAGGENWESVGGDNTTKETAQYASTGWLTAPATPGSATVATQSSVATESDKAASAGSTSSYGPAAVGSSVKKDTVALVQQPSRLALRIETPVMAYVGQPVTLTAVPSGAPKVILDSLVYRWNLGDAQSAAGDELTHEYHFPGQYVIAVEAKYAAHQATARQTLTVLPVTVSLARSPLGDIHIHNDAPYEIDISGYRLVADDRIVFPDQSIILPDSTITIASSRIADTAAATVALYDRAGRLVDVSSYALPQRTSVTPAALTVRTSETATLPAAPRTPPSVAPRPASSAGAGNSNFSFATMPSQQSVPTTVVNQASLSVASTVPTTRRTTSSAPVATGVTATDTNRWWTTGGLIVLLSGTILGLWWQRRLT